MYVCPSLVVDLSVIRFRQPVTYPRGRPSLSDLGDIYSSRQTLFQSVNLSRTCCKSTAQSFLFSFIATNLDRDSMDLRSTTSVLENKENHPYPPGSGFIPQCQQDGSPIQEDPRSSVFPQNRNDHNDNDNDRDCGCNSHSLHHTQQRRHRELVDELRQVHQCLFFCARSQSYHPTTQ